MKEKSRNVLNAVIMKQKSITKVSESSKALLYESASGNQIDDLPLELI